MKKKMALLITASVLSISMLSACGSDSGQTNHSSTTNAVDNKKAADQSATTAAKEASSNTAGNVDEIKVEAKDFEFDKKVIHVKKGDKVKITLHSDDGGHGLAIPEYNVDIQGNGSAEFTADKTGTYKYFCSIMCGSGHTDMTGKLVVE